VLSRIFGLRRDEVTGGWRKLHNEFHNLYSSPSIIRLIKSRSMRLGYACSTNVVEEESILDFAGKARGSKTLT
jgi:hypothetical protein